MEENTNALTVPSKVNNCQCLKVFSCVCYPIAKSLMAQEALKIQIDNLQWEINRLDNENQKLRDISPERS